MRRKNGRDSNLMRGKEQSKVLLLALAFEFAKANWSNGRRSRLSGEISTRNSRACGSLAQHSGDFVFMLF